MENTTLTTTKPASLIVEVKRPRIFEKVHCGCKQMCKGSKTKLIHPTTRRRHIKIQKSEQSEQSLVPERLGYDSDGSVYSFRTNTPSNSPREKIPKKEELVTKPSSSSTSLSQRLPLTQSNLKANHIVHSPKKSIVASTSKQPVTLKLPSSDLESSSSSESGRSTSSVLSDETTISMKQKAARNRKAREKRSDNKRFEAYRQASDRAGFGGFRNDFGASPTEAERELMWEYDIEDDGRW